MEDRTVSPANIHFEPGSGLHITSDDGQFGISIGARGQSLYTLEHEDGADVEHDLTVRRARIKIGGHAFSPDVRFAMQLALSPSDLGIKDGGQFSPLLDWYLELRQLRDLEVRVGQFMTPTNNRERSVSSGNLELVDRSIMSGEFNLDRDVGIEIKSRDLFGADLLAYRLGVFSGHGRDAQGFDAMGPMYSGRLDVTPFGRFEDYSEVDFDGGAPRLSFGGGYAFVDHGERDRGPRGNTPDDGGTTNSHHVFGDFMFKWEGFSLMGELAYREGERLPGDAVDEMGSPMPVTEARNGLGLNVQAGYLLPFAPIGIAARYSTVRHAATSSLGDGNEVTAGLSYYPGQHAYKIQADYSRLWDADMSTGTDRVRVQVQLSL